MRKGTPDRRRSAMSHFTRETTAGAEEEAAAASCPGAAAFASVLSACGGSTARDHESRAKSPTPSQPWAPQRHVGAGGRSRLGGRGAARGGGANKNLFAEIVLVNEEELDWPPGPPGPAAAAAGSAAIGLGEEVGEVGGPGAELGVDDAGRRGREGADARREEARALRAAAAARAFSDRQLGRCDPWARGPCGKGGAAASRASAWPRMEACWATCFGEKGAEALEPVTARSITACTASGQSCSQGSGAAARLDDALRTRSTTWLRRGGRAGASQWAEVRCGGDVMTAGGE